MLFIKCPPPKEKQNMKRLCCKRINGVKIIFLLMVLASLFISSCKSVPYEKIDVSVSQGLYEQGLEEIQKAKEKKAYKKKDILLYYLEGGMLAHYAKQYEKSNELLKVAEEKIAASVTKSISRELGSYLVNDRVKEYGGEDYENLYVNIFSALNYYFLAMEEDAMVEIRRLQNKLKALKSKYLPAIRNAQKKITETAKKIAYNKNVKKSKFSNSALAQYLGMLFYRSRIQPDDARINYENIRLAFANQKHIYTFPLPSTLKDELYVPREKARLNVISFYGLSPIKKEEILRIPIPPANWLKIALPVLQVRPSQVARVELIISEKKPFADEQKKEIEKQEEEDDEEDSSNTQKENSLKTDNDTKHNEQQVSTTQNFEPIEDISAVAAETFKSHVTLIYLKTILRSLAKTVTAAVLTQQSMERQNRNYENEREKINDTTQIGDGGTEKNQFLYRENNLQSNENRQTQNDTNSQESLLFGLFGLFTQLYAELSERADIRISRYFPSMAAISGITLEPGIYSFSVKYYNDKQENIFSEHFKDMPIKSKQLNLFESYYSH